MSLLSTMKPRKVVKVERDHLPTPPGRRWPGALRWFSAEFLVVVSGVLVALAVNAWWNERQDRTRETVYLQQLAADLEASETEMSTAYAFFIGTALASARVAQAFWEPVPPPPDSLVQSLWIPLRSGRYRPVLGTVHALVATGDLRLIRSRTLRSQLMAFAEYAQANLDDIQRHDETYFRPAAGNLRHTLDPVLLSHLRELGGPAQPGQGGALRPLPSGERRPPFTSRLDDLYGDTNVYHAYNSMLVAHRNQALHYLRILDRTRQLRGAVHLQLHGTPEPENCQLEPVDGAFVGSCGAPLHGLPLLSLRLAQPVAPGAANEAETGTGGLVLSGHATLAGGDDTPIELAVDATGNGIASTAFGLYAVRFLVRHPDTGRLSFRLHAAAEADPGSLPAGITNVYLN